MKAVKLILNEQLKNFYLIQRLAQFQIKISNHDNYLGVAWEIINPLIQISVYWFVFGVGFRKNADVHGDIPYIIWMIVGISIWFFINQGLLEGTKSISMRYNQVSKMDFPMSTLPSYIIMSKFYSHLLLLFIVIIICSIYGYPPTIYTLQLLFYIPLVYIFVLSVTLVTSTLSVLIRDTQMIVQSLLRILFYLSPIILVTDGKTHLDKVVENVIKFNPIYFLAESYRSAILYHEWYIFSHWMLFIYIIMFISIFFIIGSIFHVSFRDKFGDFL